MSFNRVIRVTAGPEGSQGFQISENRIQFKAKKTSQKTPNEIELTIFNLSEATANVIKKVSNSIVVEVGYEDEGGLKTFFTGDITKGEFDKQYPETVTTIVAYDGIKNYRESNISVSYAEGTRLKRIIQDFSNSIGYPLDKGIDIPDYQFANGYAFIGKVKDGLTRVLLSVEKTWSIQNKKLVILGEKEALQNKAIVISPKTGMIGSPKPIEDMKDQVSVENRLDKVEIESLLFPEIVPGSTVKVESKAINSFYKCEYGEYNGDNFYNDFTMVGEYIKLDL